VLGAPPLFPGGPPAMQGYGLAAMGYPALGGPGAVGPGGVVQHFQGAQPGLGAVDGAVVGGVGGLGPQDAGASGLDLASAAQLMGMGPSSDSKKKKKKKEKDKKEKKKKKKDNSDSSSGSSTESEDENKAPYLCWKDTSGSGTRVSPLSLAKLNSVKFKKRGDILVMAAQHEGALAAGLLAEVRSRQKGAGGVVTKSGQLRDVSMFEWARTAKHGVTDPNALRELLHIGAAMHYVNRRKLPQLMDLMTQRVHSIQKSASAGGKQEEARKLELWPNEGGLTAPSGMALIA
jgi:hypothetical protein